MKEQLVTNPLDGANMNEAYFGPWIPRPEPLPEALKPHVLDVNGKPSVPARLVHRVNNALNNPTTQK